MKVITYIIKQSDVRKGRFGFLGDGKNATYIEIDKCSCCGRPSEQIPVDFTFMGGVQESDVGKIMKRIDGIWYVENTEQFERRVAKEKFQYKELYNKPDY